jgi:hypothetical protein
MTRIVLAVAALLLLLALGACGWLPPCGGYECASGIVCEGRCP